MATAASRTDFPPKQTSISGPPDPSHQSYCACYVPATAPATGGKRQTFEKTEEMTEYGIATTDCGARSADLAIVETTTTTTFGDEFFYRNLWQINAQTWCKWV
jgi:hypothetical protein